MKTFRAFVIAILAIVVVLFGFTNPAQANDHTQDKSATATAKTVKSPTKSDVKELNQFLAEVKAKRKFQRAERDGTCEAQSATGDQPAVELCDITYGEGSYSVLDAVSASARLKLKGNVKVYLNVHSKPMKIGAGTNCFDVPVGTPIQNEVVDPTTGQHVVIDYNVQPGDTKMCTKAGSSQVYKKSCGNRVWGVPGHPSKPPANLPHIKGKVKVVDRLVWKLRAKLRVIKKAYAMAHVTSSDGTCEAYGSVENEASIDLDIFARFRTTTRAKATGKGGIRELTISAENNLDLQGKLKAKGVIALQGKAGALCKTTTPPPSYSPPTVNANANACVKQGETSGVINAVGTNPNNVAAPGSFTLTPGSTNQVGTVAAGGTASTQFTGLGIGTYTVTFSLGAPINKSASVTVQVIKCDVPQGTPPEVQPDAVNQVLKGNSRPLTAKVKVPAGRQGVVHVVSCNGGTITSGQDQVVNGTGGFVTVTVGYTAPGEVPPQGFNTGCETPAGKDRINWSVTDVADPTLKDAKAAYHDIVAPVPDP